MNYKNLSALADNYKLILASGSPRRFDLLNETGIKFERIIPSTDEIHKKDEPAYHFAERLACEKALSISLTKGNTEIVLGCDTIVVLKERILGKPIDKADALKILSMLSSHQHIVCTSVALTQGENILKSGYELTKVFFNNVTQEQITSYIETGEPMDKAGAYGIQGMGAFLVDRIDGNLDNVIGLPRTLLENFAGEIMENFNSRSS